MIRNSKSNHYNGNSYYRSHKLRGGDPQADFAIAQPSTSLLSATSDMPTLAQPSTSLLSATSDMPTLAQPSTSLLSATSDVPVDVNAMALSDTSADTSGSFLDRTEGALEGVLNYGVNSAQNLVGNTVYGVGAVASGLVSGAENAVDYTVNGTTGFIGQTASLPVPSAEHLMPELGRSFVNAGENTTSSVVGAIGAVVDAVVGAVGAVTDAIGLTSNATGSTTNAPALYNNSGKRYLYNVTFDSHLYFINSQHNGLDASRLTHLVVTHDRQTAEDYAEKISRDALQQGPLVHDGKRCYPLVGTVLLVFEVVGELSEVDLGENPQLNQLLSANADLVNYSVDGKKLARVTQAGLNKLKLVCAKLTSQIDSISDHVAMYLYSTTLQSMNDSDLKLLKYLLDNKNKEVKLPVSADVLSGGSYLNPVDFKAKCKKYKALAKALEKEALRRGTAI